MACNRNTQKVATTAEQNGINRVSQTAPTLNLSEQVERRLIWWAKRQIKELAVSKSIEARPEIKALSRYTTNRLGFKVGTPTLGELEELKQRWGEQLAQVQTQQADKFDLMGLTGYRWLRKKGAVVRLLYFCGQK